MKRFTLFFLSLVIASTAFCQADNPVQWSFSSIKKGDKIYEVTLTAAVAKPWHIYSQTTPQGGPVPTQITFKSNPLIILDGDIKETGKLQVIHDDNFKVDVKYYSDKVVFTQIVKLKAGVKTHATGILEYMVCNDEKCLPPKKIPFDITLQ